VTAAAFKGSGRDAPVAVTIQLPRPAGRSGRSAGGLHETEVSFVVIDTDGKVRAGERILCPIAASATSPESGSAPGLRFVRSAAAARGALSASRGGSRGDSACARLGVVRARGARLRGPEARDEQRPDLVAPGRARVRVGRSTRR
jgi:hypothetical protein